MGVKALAALALAIIALRLAVAFHPRYGEWAESEAAEPILDFAWWLDLCVILMFAIAVLAMPQAACAQSRADVEREISAAFDRSEVSRAEHLALGVAVLATAADIYTTRRGIEGGCVERNPLYGARPPASRLVAVGAVPLAAGYYAASRPGMDVTFGALIFAAWRLRAAWRNSRLDCYG